jgi:hypothetical protein
MDYVRYEYIKSDSKDIPDAQVFVVYRKEEGTWAFAMRINGQFTLTKFQSQDTDAGGVKQAKKQILFCKTYGWSYLGKKTWNTEVDDYEAEFLCLYCRRTTYDISSPCPCRNKRKEDLFKKTDSGIILPI